MELPVGDVMQQSAKRRHLRVGAFRLANLLGQFPDTMDVMPVVPRSFRGKPGLDVTGHAFDKAGGIFCGWIHVNSGFG